MQFDDHQLTLEVSGQTVTIIIKGDLIKLLWERRKLLTTAPEIIDANLPLIRALALQKIDEGRTFDLLITDLTKDGRVSEDRIWREGEPDPRSINVAFPNDHKAKRLN